MSRTVEGLRNQDLPDALIRALAYGLWESEGRPDGRDKEHWEQACRKLKPDHARDAGSAVGTTRSR